MRAANDKERSNLRAKIKRKGARLKVGRYATSANSSSKPSMCAGRSKQRPYETIDGG